MSYMRSHRRERVKLARSIGTHTHEEWQSMVKACGNMCVRCDATGIPLSKDHISPIYQGGSDSIENLQPLCRSCNSGKGSDDTDFRPNGWPQRLTDPSFPLTRTPRFGVGYKFKTGWRRNIVATIISINHSTRYDQGSIEALRYSATYAASSGNTVTMTDIPEHKIMRAEHLNTYK